MDVNNVRGLVMQVFAFKLRQGPQLKLIKIIIQFFLVIKFVSLIGVSVIIISS